MLKRGADYRALLLFCDTDPMSCSMTKSEHMLEMPFFKFEDLHFMNLGWVTKRGWQMGLLAHHYVIYKTYV